MKKSEKKSAVKRLKELLADRIMVRRPESWPELSEREAWLMYALLAAPGVELEEVPFYAFMALNEFSVCGRNSRGEFVVSGREGVFLLDPYCAAELARPLGFLKKEHSGPWRPERFRKYRAISADLSDLCLADWLAIENYMQRVIATGDFSLLDNLNLTLMKRPKGLQMFLSGLRMTFTPAERLAVFHWMQSVKNHVRMRFPEFYSESGPVDPESVTPMALQGAMDAQIRALTKGDITKENEVLAQPVYRALAELNALAGEYRKIKAQGS